MMDGHGPFLLGLVDREVDDLDCRTFAGEYLSVTDDLANHAVDTFDRVRGVDRFANLRWILKHRGDVLPVIPPASGNHRVAIVRASFKIEELENLIEDEDLIGKRIKIA